MTDDVFQPTPDIPAVPDDKTLVEFWQMCAEVMAAMRNPVHPAVLQLKAAISIQVAMRAEIEGLRHRLGLPTVSLEEGVDLLGSFISLNT